MTDYARWKVVDLKEELKRRGIPQTGLRLKQNIVERLLEDDVKNAPADASETVPAAIQDGEPVEVDGNETFEGGDASALTQDQIPPGKAEETSQEQEQEGAVETVEAGKVAIEQSRKESVSVQEEQQLTTLNEHGLDEKEQGDNVLVTEARGHRQETVTESDKVASQQEDDKVAVEQPEQKPLTEQAEQRPSEIESDKTAQEVTTATAHVHPGAPSETKDEEPTATLEQDGVEMPPQEPPIAAISQHTSAISAPTHPEANAALSTPVPVEELIDDARKRKRRSQSPAPTPGALANKKIRAEDGSAQLLRKEDEEAVDSLKPADATYDSIPRNDREEPENRQSEQLHQPLNETADLATHPPTSQDLPSRRVSRSGLTKQDARFKGLFANADHAPLRPPSPPAEAGLGVEPARHAATTALYIDGLMRPLQPGTLRNHLISLGSAPGSSPNPGCVIDFYLDPIKTHCFVSFSNVSEASRARSALHGTVWPNERNRKVLFADFIPEDKLQDWIRIEEDSQRGGRGPPPRWAVSYESTDEGTVALHQEVDPGAVNAAQADTRVLNVPQIPTGPRNSFANRDRRPVRRPAESSYSSRPAQGFKALDELFMSTTAKPKLYYLPVLREVADRRLDRLDALARKGSFPRRGGDETRRISFEDTDLFVDQGPEFGNRNRRRRFRGGGRFADSWRA